LGVLSGLAWAPDGNTIWLGTATGLHSYTGADLTYQGASQESALQGGRFVFDAAGSALFLQSDPTGAVTLVRRLQPGIGLDQGEFSIPGRPMETAALSPDGRLLAFAVLASSNPETRRVEVWNVAAGQKQLILGERVTTRVNCLAFSLNRRYLAAGTEGGQLLLWDVQLGQVVIQNQAHSRAINGVAFSPDDRVLAAASNDATVSLWEPASGDSLGALPKLPTRATGIAFSPDGQWLAVGTHGGEVRFWELSNSVYVPAALTLYGAQEAVVGLTFSPNSARLIGQELNGGVRLWDLGSRRQLGQVAEALGVLTSLAWSPTGNLLVAGGGYKGSTGVLLFWDPNSGQLLRRLEQLRGDQANLAFDAAGQTLALASVDDDQIIYLLDVASGQVRRKLATPGKLGGGLALGPDGRYLVAQSAVGLLVYDLPAWSEARVLSNTSYKLLQIGADGRTLLTVQTVMRHDQLQFWDLPAGQIVRTLDLGIGFGVTPAIAVDWTQAISGEVQSDGSLALVLWDLASGQPLARYALPAGAPAPRSQAAYATASARLAYSPWNGLLLFNTTTAQLLATAPVRTTLLAFSPDGRSLATGREVVVLWEVR
jgi:WD40 repeat protein